MAFHKSDVYYLRVQTEAGEAGHQVTAIYHSRAEPSRLPPS